MEREFTVIMEKDGEEFVVTCPAFPDAVARAPTREKAIEEMKRIITERSNGTGETGGK